jgi:hypothetical protein
MKTFIPVMLFAAAVSSFAATGRAPGLRRPVPACPAIAASSISVGYAGPVSGCSSSNSTQCQTGEAITFTVSLPAANTACGDYSVSWNFGDGATLSGSSVVHTFSTAGSFPVSVIVANARQTLAPLTTALSIKAGIPPNRVQNGSFDRDLAGWGFDNALPGGQGLPGDASWSNVYALNSTTSGSILLRSTGINPDHRSFQQVQCVPLTPNERYAFGGDVRYGGDAAGSAILAVGEFTSADCTGSVVQVFSRSVFFSAPLAWTHAELIAVAGSGAHSGYLFLAAGMTGTGTTYQAWFDNVYVRSSQ